MAEKIEDHLTEQLCEAILSLNNKKQIACFLEDICTIGEYKASAQRLEVARLLDEGVKYDEIVECLGASTATISRVKRSLVYGEDGYKMVLENLKKKRHKPPKLVRKARFEKARAEKRRELRENG